MQTTLCKWVTALVLTIDLTMLHAVGPCDACGGCGVGQYCPASGPGVGHAITCPAGTITGIHYCSDQEDSNICEDPLPLRVETLLCVIDFRTAGTVSVAVHIRVSTACVNWCWPNLRRFLLPDRGCQRPRGVPHQLLLSARG
jgi:hypothetical protein